MKKLVATILVLGLLLASVPAMAAGDSIKIAYASDQKIYALGTAGSDGASLGVIHAIFDTLFKWDGDSVLQPCIATAYEVSEDGKVYTLTLRDDVYFSNGTKMTAEDVQFTLDNAHSHIIGPNLIINYDRCEIVDDTTVEIYLTDAYAPFVNGLASRAACIISKAYFEEVGQEGYTTAPIGTGPYKFVEQTLGKTLKITYNDLYWGGEPAIKDIEWVYIADTNTQMIALETGEVDVVQNPNMSDCLMLDQSKGLTYRIEDGSSKEYVRFNCTTSSLCSDKNLRLAISSAINGEDINLAVWEGYGKVSDSPLWYGYTGRPDDGTYITYEYSPEAAKAYLEQSGYNGETLTLLAPSGHDIYAIVIQAQLAAVGINIELQILDAATATAMFGMQEFDLYLAVQQSSLLDMDGFDTPYSLHNQKGNSMGYDQQDRIEELIKLGRTQRDEEDRKETYRQFSNLLIEEGYERTLVQLPFVIAYNEKVQGIDLNLYRCYDYTKWSFAE